VKTMARDVEKCAESIHTWFFNIPHFQVDKMILAVGEKMF